MRANNGRHSNAVIYVHIKDEAGNLRTSVPEGETSSSALGRHRRLHVSLFSWSIVDSRLADSLKRVCLLCVFASIQNRCRCGDVLLCDVMSSMLLAMYVCDVLFVVPYRRYHAHAVAGCTMTSWNLMPCIGARRPLHLARHPFLLPYALPATTLPTHLLHTTTHYLLPFAAAASARHLHAALAPLPQKDSSCHILSGLLIQNPDLATG